jgi:hypothetical protein
MNDDPLPPILNHATSISAFAAPGLAVDGKCLCCSSRRVKMSKSFRVRGGWPARRRGALAAACGLIGPCLRSCSTVTARVWYYERQRIYGGDR